MSVYKAVKLEVMILTENGMSNEEIIKWTDLALKNYADFEEVYSKIVEVHENVMTNIHDEASA